MKSDTVDLPTQAPSGARYQVLLWLSAAAVIAYAGRNCLGVASNEVQDDLGIDVLRMSDAMSAFFWGYALLQVPAGWLTRRLGVRAALTLFALAWSAACALVGAAVDGSTLVAAQVVFGVAQAGIFPASAEAISRWIPLSRRAFASGALGSSMSVGGAIGAAMTGALVTELSWRVLFFLFAAPGVVWAMGFGWWYRNRPEDHRSVNDAELKLLPKEKSPAGANAGQRGLLVAILVNFDLWMICGQQFFRAAGYVFYATWFPEYLRQTHGVSVKESGFLSALPLLGVVAGALCGGLLVDWLWSVTGSRRASRQGVGIAAMLSCAALIGAAFFIDDALVAVIFITVGSFCAAVGGPAAYTVTIDKGGDFVAPIFGVMNMSGNIGAAMCPLVVGRFVAMTGQNWSLVLLLFVGNYLAAAVCWSLLNPNGVVAPVSEE